MEIPKPKYKIGDVVLVLIKETVYQFEIKSAWYNGEYGTPNVWQYATYKAIEDIPFIEENEILYKL